HPLEAVMCCVLVAIVAVTFSQVIFRYVLETPLSWSDEGARFLLMWLAMLSAAYAFKTRSHFALAFIVNRFGGRLRWAASLFAVAVVALFLVVFIVKAVEYTLSVSDVTGPGTRLSMAVPASSTIVGGILMLYYVLRNGWDDLRGGPSKSG
ncbi:MAG: TRAP transporter small permease, partial [Kiloniellales bacterium]